MAFGAAGFELFHEDGGIFEQKEAKVAKEVRGTEQADAGSTSLSLLPFAWNSFDLREPGMSMIHLNVWLTVKEASDAEKVRGLLAEAGRLSRQEPGCVRWEAYQSNNDPTRFMLHEWWESQALLDEHRKAEAYTTIYQPQVIPLVTREPHPSTLVE